MFTTLAIFSHHSLADSPRAQVLTEDQLSGNISEGLPTKEFYGNQAQMQQVFRTADGKLAFGAFSWTVKSAKTAVIKFDDYPIDETMYFIEGGMKIIDTDGNVTEAGPGEFLFIPKGWSGTHYTQNMKKISIRYGDKVAAEVQK